ncbi:hypothetical protein [Pectobacterium sp. CFBP8739]|uniref:hypothetical protein n=1 Tax=Pectobacterium TaxID=122277 RepID=UPI0015DD9D25|nr:hypothetical protein [Pectobacterium sp. CFBP8739]MBA0169080.1 hypothetical protein [Pectobacterium sp. CFBP8739]
MIISIHNIAYPVMLGGALSAIAQAAVLTEGESEQTSPLWSSMIIHYLGLPDDCVYLPNVDRALISHR